MFWVEQFLEPILEHRDKGHWLRFTPKGGEARIHCLLCKEIVCDGDRNMVHEIYEAVLQWPSRKPLVLERDPDK